MTQRSPREWIIPLTLAQCETIVQALAELPFKTVFKLIAQLNGHVQRLFEGEVDPSAARDFAFSAADLACVVKALGEQPFNRVHTLLAAIHAHLQLQAAGETADLRREHGARSTAAVEPAPVEPAPVEPAAVEPAEADHAAI